jgi:hypothetical protein
MRVLLAEDRKQHREQMFSGDGARREEQFTAERNFLAGNFPTGLSMKVKDSLSVVIEFLARSGK